MDRKVHMLAKNEDLSYDIKIGGSSYVKVSRLLFLCVDAERFSVSFVCQLNTGIRFYFYTCMYYV